MTNTREQRIANVVPALFFQELHRVDSQSRISGIAGSGHQEPADRLVRRGTDHLPLFQLVNDDADAPAALRLNIANSRIRTAQ